MENDKEETLLDCPFCGSKARRVAASLICCEDTVNCGANVEVSPAATTEDMMMYSRDFWNRRKETGNIYNKDIKDLTADELKFLGYKISINAYNYFKFNYPLISYIQNYNISDVENMSSKDISEMLKFVTFIKDYVKRYDEESYNVGFYERYYKSLENKENCLTYDQFLEKINENKNNDVSKSN